MQPYLFLRPDSRNWQFRRTVPRHLRPLIGKRDIIRSTLTSDYREAQRIARKLACDCDTLFTSHDPQLNTSRPIDLGMPAIPMTPDAIVPVVVSPAPVSPTPIIPSASDTLISLQAELAAMRNEICQGMTRPRESSSPEVKATGQPSAHDTWDLYIEHWVKQRCPEPKTADDSRTQIKRLRAYTKDKSPVELTPDEIRAYAAHLENNEGLSRQRVKTIFALLRPIMQHAVDNPDTALEINPFASVKISVSRKETRDRQPFEVSHIQKLLQTEVFTNGKLPAKAGRHAAFWLPLLSLFNGAREEELGQLFVQDVVTINNRLFLRITDIEEDQGVKNAISRRHIPIHAELIKIGFANYVEMIRASGEERLFPDLSPNRYGVFTAKFSTWFNEYLDQHVVDDPRYNFHSFRHFYQERAGWCRLSDYQIDGILGHQPSGMGGRYGMKQGGRRVFDPMTLAEGMDLFRINEIDFSWLYGKY